MERDPGWAQFVVCAAAVEEMIGFWFVGGTALTQSAIESPASLLLAALTLIVCRDRLAAESRKRTAPVGSGNHSSVRPSGSRRVRAIAAGPSVRTTPNDDQ